MRAPIMGPIYEKKKGPKGREELADKVVRALQNV